MPCFVQSRDTAEAKRLPPPPYLPPPHVAHLCRSYHHTKHTKKPPCAQQENQCARRLKKGLPEREDLRRERYQSATLPAAPKSRVAEAIPKARNTRLRVGKVIIVCPFSNLEICARCTPIRSPSSSCVSFWACLALRIASPK